MQPGPDPRPLPPAAAAYLAALNGWLAAGPDRDDTPLPELLNLLAGEIRHTLATTDRRYRDVQTHYPDVAALLSKAAGQSARPSG